MIYNRDQCNLMIKSSILAGHKIMEIYKQDFDFSEKKDGSPVTMADIAAEKIIFEILSNSEFNYPFIGEENIAKDRDVQYDAYYCVDPLDGTKEFIKKNGEFTVNIALIKGKNPFFGVIYAPALDILFYGGKDIGSFFLDKVSMKIQNDASFEIDNLFDKGKKISVNYNQDNIRAITSRSHLDEKTNELIKVMGCKDILGAGSSLKFCYIAKGDADLYPRYGRTMEWDTASGQAILEGAGGVVCKLDNLENFTYNKEEGYANPSFVAASDYEIINLLKDHI